MRSDVLIRGAHDLARIDELFQSVRAPTHYTGDCEHGGEKLHGKSEHLIAESAVKVHVRANALVRLAAFAEKFRSHFLYRTVKREFVFPAFRLAELADAVAEYLRAGVGYLVDGVSQTVYKAAAVESLFVEYLGKIGAQFAFVLPVADMLFYISNIRQTFMFAPPCLGPLREPMAAAIAE